MSEYVGERDVGELLDAFGVTLVCAIDAFGVTVVCGIDVFGATLSGGDGAFGLRVVGIVEYLLHR